MNVKYVILVLNCKVMMVLINVYLSVRKIVYNLFKIVTTNVYNVTHTTIQMKMVIVNLQKKLFRIVLFIQERINANNVDLNMH